MSFYTDDEMKYMGCSCLIMILLFLLFVVLPIALCLIYAEDIFIATVEGTHRMWEVVDSVWSK